MVDFCDVYAYIKLINRDDGKALDSGVTLNANDAINGVTVRYVVVNDSKVVTGNATIAGSLWKNNVKVNPSPVAGVKVTLPSKQLWTYEYIVNNPKPSSATYKAQIIGDVGAMMGKEEETEKNNTATATFTFSQQGVPN